MLTLASTDQHSADRTFARLADSTGMNATAARRVYAHLLASGSEPMLTWSAMNAYLVSLVNRESTEAQRNGDRADLWDAYLASVEALEAHAAAVPVAA
jgi:hypothetical protein